MKKVIVMVFICILLLFPGEVYAAMSDEFASAQAVEWNTNYNGAISATNVDDYFEVTLAKSGSVTIKSMADIDALDYIVYDENGNEIWKNTAKRNSGTGAVSESNIVQLTKGTYYLCLKQNSGYSGEYRVSFSFASANESFEEAYGGNNNSRATASVIELSREYTGQLAANDRKDVYTFTLSESGQIDFEAEWTNHIIKIMFLDDNSEDDTDYLWYSADPQNTTFSGAGSYAKSIHLTEGKYYIAFYVEDRAEDFEGTYTFKTSYSSAQESFRENNVDKNDNTIFKANLIELGKEYRGQLASNDKTDFYQFDVPEQMTVYAVAESEGKFVYSICEDNGTEITKVSTTREFEKKIELNAGSYYFKVYGPYNSTSGDYTFTVAEYKLNKPVITSVSNVTGGIKLKWNEVLFAEGYTIYRKENGKSWSELTEIKDGATLTYTDKTVKGGKTYSYKIVAYNDELISEESASKSLKYLARPVVTLSNTVNGVKVSWKKVTGATGYDVYRSTVSGKLGSIVKTVKDKDVVSYTDKSTKNGTMYYYTVKAYSGNTQSYKSTAKKYVRLTSTSITSLKNNGSKKMTVKWKKNAKATGYEVQYATKSGFGNAKTKKYTGASGISKTISGLTKSKKYYVRVRSYKTVNGTKYYSAWSAKKSVNISK